MTDIITEIMVEVLRIFGIATKELRRGTASEFRIGYLWAITEGRVEKFLRKLAGIADLESALKNLDRLTQEIRMALAEVDKAEEIGTGVKDIRDKVEVIGGKVEDIGDELEDVGNKVEDVGNKVEDVGNKVEDIGDKVQFVNDNVSVVINGAPCVSAICTIPLTYILSDGRDARVAVQEVKSIIQQTAGVIDQVKCSLLQNFISLPAYT